MTDAASMRTVVKLVLLILSWDISDTNIIVRSDKVLNQTGMQICRE
jgi:hypothetical protein